MQILFLGAGVFQIKTKEGTITTGEKSKINDFTLESDGEYEVASIEAEIINNITIFHAEEMSIVYLDKRKKPLTDKEVERIDGVDILLVPVGGGDVFEAKEALEAINQIEPKVVIPMHYQDISAFSKIGGITTETAEVLKISKNILPEEGRRIIILHAKSQ